MTSRAGVFTVALGLIACTERAPSPEPVEPIPDLGAMEPGADETGADDPGADDPPSTETGDVVSLPEPLADELPRCCDCETRECYPATSVLECSAGEQWCWLDQDGNPSGCWEACDPLGTCCDCQAIACRVAREGECTGHWERWCDLGDELECYEQCL